MKFDKVEGKVISEDLEPMENVIVRTMNKKYKTVTAPSGNFQNSTPRKHQKSIVQYLGYEIDTIEVSVTKPVNSTLRVFDGTKG